MGLAAGLLGGSSELSLLIESAAALPASLFQKHESCMQKLSVLQQILTAEQILGQI